MLYSVMPHMGIKVDFVLSCGAECRPAHYAKMLCLRKFSSPCDWMMNYSLSCFLEILRSEGKLMFRNAKYDEVKKWVYDADNGMISMHDFHCDQPLEDQLPAFYEKMVRRTKNTIKQILKSRRVGIIMNRNIAKKEIVDFATSMNLLFPDCYFFIVNVNDKPYQQKLKTEYIIETEKYTITEISFNDAHENGREIQNNPSCWRGNVRIWENLMLNYFHVKGRRLQYIKAILGRRVKQCVKFVCKLFGRRVNMLLQYLLNR